MRVEIVQQPPEEPPPAAAARCEAHHVDPLTGEDEMALAAAGAETLARATASRRSARPQRNPNDPATWGKVGRNEPCPCGSGKKYKHCHGRFA